MIEIVKIKKFLIDSTIYFVEKVDLKTKTWIKRGGIAEIWVQPINMNQFELLSSWCQLNDIQFEVIGNTSNCYFLNDYHPELVVSTLKLNEMHFDGDSITCDCGYNMTRLSKYCISQGISGYEGFIGLPGTVGGAAINNAGCYGSLISDVVESVRIMNNGKIIVLTNEQLNYEHRNSSLKSKEIEGIVMGVTFKINKKEDSVLLEKQAKYFQIQRKTYQEHNYPNLGTTFSVLEFYKLSIILRFIYEITRCLLNVIIRNPVRKQKLNTKLFLLFRPTNRFCRYVSEYGVACFTWKDAKADSAFKYYLNFIKKETTKFTIEIDIKGKI